MKLASRLIAGAAVALLPIGAVLAQTPPSEPSDPQTQQPQQQGGGATFESLDTNADGRISRTEAAANANVSAQFSSYDLNGDGFIERSEVNSTNNQSDSSSSETTPPDSTKPPKQ